MEEQERKQNIKDLIKRNEVEKVSLQKNGCGNTEKEHKAKVDKLQERYRNKIDVGIKMQCLLRFGMSKDVKARANSHPKSS